MDKGAALIEVLRAHGVHVGRTGNVSCPFHADQKPSMSLERTKGLYHCHSCGEGGDVFTLVQKLGNGEQVLQQVQEKPSEPDREQERLRPVSVARMERLETLLQGAEANLSTNPQAQDYIASRGFTEATVAQFRLGLGTRAMGSLEGTLVIPYLAPNGRPVALRTRCIQDHSHDGHGKYRTAPGDPVRMFNLNAIVNNPTANEIHVAEGEGDVMSLTQCGLLAVGFPGVQTVKPHHIDILSGFDRIYVWGDNDVAGQKFNDMLMGRLQQAQAVQVPEGDVNEMLVARGKPGILGLIGRRDDA